VGTLVAEVTESLRHLERARAIELCAAPSLLGRCDAAILRRVVENLLSNAIKHTPAGERILVSVASEERWIRIEVRDNGRGVPPDARERIFEKFGALETRAAGRYHSAGLGLSFCKLAIEALGGAIGVQDGDPRGSVFWCSVPKV
jgi:signal transduction histidine kinase